jgi:hypothetical protein
MRTSSASRNSPSTSSAMRTASSAPGARRRANDGFPWRVPNRDRGAAPSGQGGFISSTARLACAQSASTLASH